MMARRSRTNGFTLTEVIVGVAIFGALVIGALTFVWTSHRILSSRRIQDGGRVLCVAPSASTFAEAVVLHGRFMDRLKNARAVYVFGGVHPALASGAAESMVKPLASSALPPLSGFDAGLPLAPLKFYQLYQGGLGPMAAGGNAEDFTVVVVGPRNNRLELVAMIQVRSSSLLVTDGDVRENFIRRAVQYFDADGDNSDYVFLESAGAAASAPVGATHSWHRYQEGVVAEEGPVTAVFPDPWRHEGNGLKVGYQPPTFSRFIYLLHVTR